MVVVVGSSDGGGGGGDRCIGTGCCSPKKSLQKCQQRTCALVILTLEQNSEMSSLLKPSLSFLLCPDSL